MLGKLIEGMLAEEVRASKALQEQVGQYLPEWATQELAS